MAEEDKARHTVKLHAEPISYLVPEAIKPGQLVRLSTYNTEPMVVVILSIADSRKNFRYLFGEECHYCTAISTTKFEIVEGEDQSPSKIHHAIPAPYSKELLTALEQAEKTVEDHHLDEPLQPWKDDIW